MLSVISKEKGAVDESIGEDSEVVVELELGDDDVLVGRVVELKAELDLEVELELVVELELAVEVEL